MTNFVNCARTAADVHCSRGRPRTSKWPRARRMRVAAEAMVSRGAEGRWRSPCGGWRWSSHTSVRAEALVAATACSVKL